MTITAYMNPTYSGSPINWLSDNIYCALLSTAGTYLQDTMILWAHVSGSEVSPSGTYSAGGKLISGKTVVYTAASNINTFDADDVTWTGATITAGSYCLYDSSITGSPILLVGASDAAVTSTSGSMTVTWSGSGIWKTTST
jgi:hypothetical protein